MTSEVLASSFGDVGGTAAPAPHDVLLMANMTAAEERISIQVTALEGVTSLLQKESEAIKNLLCRLMDSCDEAYDDAFSKSDAGLPEVKRRLQRAHTTSFQNSPGVQGLMSMQANINNKNMSGSRMAQPSTPVACSPSSSSHSLEVMKPTCLPGSTHGDSQFDTDLCSSPKWLKKRKSDSDFLLKTSPKRSSLVHDFGRHLPKNNCDNDSTEGSLALMLAAAKAQRDLPQTNRWFGDPPTVRKLSMLTWRRGQNNCQSGIDVFKVSSVHPRTSVTSVQPLCTSSRTSLASRHEASSAEKQPSISREVSPRSLLSPELDGIGAPQTSGSAVSSRSRDTDSDNDDNDFQSNAASIDDNFELQTVWKNVKKSTKSGSMLRGSICTGDPVMEGCDHESRPHGFLYRVWEGMMMSPTSVQCVSWDMLGMAFICYDFVMIPLNWAFDLPQAGGINVLEWMVRVFWTLTMPRTLFVGYMQPDGEIVMDPARVMKTYVSKWLGFDLVVVACDWVAIIIEGMQFVGTMRFTKVIRLLRIMRIIRLARVMKMPALAQQFAERFHSEKVLLLLGITMLSVLFVGLVHVVACAWYGIGDMTDAQGWTSRHRDAIEEQGLPWSFSYQYATSLHWALTNFVGTMEISPQNVHERIFAVIMLVLSFITSAAFVSQITAKMTRLQMITEVTERQFAKLRQYLQHHRIQSALMVRVMRSARHSLKLRQKSLVEQDIELLVDVSEPLRMEVHYKIYVGVLTVHPFFQAVNAKSQAAMRQLCHSAVSVIQVMASELLFGPDQHSVPQVFFIMSGSLKYQTRYSDEVTVGPGQWACEAALWQEDMQYLGDLQAVQDSNILVLNTEKCTEIFIAANSIKRFVSLYGQNFIQNMNESPRMDLSDIGSTSLADQLLKELLETPTFPESVARLPTLGRSLSVNPTCPLADSP